MNHNNAPKIGLHTVWERRLSLHATGLWEFAAALPEATCENLVANLESSDSTTEYLILPPDEQPENW